VSLLVLGRALDLVCVVVIDCSLLNRLRRYDSSYYSLSIPLVGISSLSVAMMVLRSAHSFCCRSSGCVLDDMHFRLRPCLLLEALTILLLAKLLAIRMSESLR